MNRDDDTKGKPQGKYDDDAKVVLSRVLTFLSPKGGYLNGQGGTTA